jgi:hypothetical protein
LTVGFVDKDLMGELEREREKNIIKIKIKKIVGW